MQARERMQGTQAFRLPVRLGNSKLQQSLANRVAQRLNPIGQGNPIQRKGSKEMHMIGHDDKSTNSDIVVLRLDKKCSKCLMDLIAGQQAMTFICIECDEVKRPNIVKQTTESWRAPRPFFFVVVPHR
jgi:hypothetical protein